MGQCTQCSLLFTNRTGSPDSSLPACASEEPGSRNIPPSPSVPPRLVPEVQPCEEDGVTSLHATGMHFRDDRSPLRSPTDPSGAGGKPVTFPFHNASGKPLSSPSDAPPGEQRQPKPLHFHPLGTQTAAGKRQNCSFLPMCWQGPWAARGQGVPHSQGWLRGSSPERCIPDTGHIAFSAWPARSQQQVGVPCARKVAEEPPCLLRGPGPQQCLEGGPTG